ncbi:MAG TPA: LysM peptidoglycan-binding domain-containing protein [Chthoniobacteraceae bacterium]|nr:LysM peptidoglycan-binding domain-containing protein [Chthoniobacteraceae bacterium]
MKIRPIRSKKQLNATTAARSMPQAGSEDDEPTMKLSNAFIVVVILHLVAVGGIYTFESIKVHRPQTVAETESVAPEMAETAPAMPVEQKVAKEPATLAAAVTHEAKPIQPPTPVAAATAQPGASAPAASNKIEDSGQVHVVAKGENPYNIAKQYDVSYDELMQLNKIEDPRRLQPNQKLRIPAKH